MICAKACVLVDRVPHIVDGGIHHCLHDAGVLAFCWNGGREGG